MAVTINRGTADGDLAQVAAALKTYAASHPQAAIDLYRQGRFSIRVRIIDPAFARIGRADRHDLVWAALEPLPEEVLSDITMLVLLTPEEMATSGANLEFEHPVDRVLG